MTRRDDIRYGDIISNGSDQAMFLCWGDPTPSHPNRPCQCVIVVKPSTGIYPLKYGQFLNVNWLELDGSVPSKMIVEAPR